MDETTASGVRARMRQAAADYLDTDMAHGDLMACVYTLAAGFRDLDAGTVKTTDGRPAFTDRPAPAVSGGPAGRFPLERLEVLARAAGELWDSTGGADPYDVLSAAQREVLDLAAALHRGEEGGSRE
jgi:hypothetical protein